MMKKYLCFKSSRKLHDSGFRYIDYGYCNLDEKGKAINIEIVGSYDVFFWDKLNVHIDVTSNGWFRLLTTDYEWGKMSGRLKKINKELGLK